VVEVTLPLWHIDAAAGGGVHPIAYGWSGTRKAIERLNEAVGEIERVARTDPALAGEGAVLLLEKLSPAVNQIDNFSYRRIR